MLAITDINGNFVTEDDTVVITYDNKLYTAGVAKVCPKSVLVLFEDEYGRSKASYISCGRFIKVKY